MTLVLVLVVYFQKPSLSYNGLVVHVLDEVHDVSWPKSYFLFPASAGECLWLTISSVYAPGYHWIYHTKYNVDSSYKIKPGFVIKHIIAMDL